VDVSGLSLLAGIALGSDAGPGRLTLGAPYYGLHGGLGYVWKIPGQGERRQPQHTVPPGRYRHG